MRVQFLFECMIGESCRLQTNHRNKKRRAVTGPEQEVWPGNEQEHWKHPGQVGLEEMLDLIQREVQLCRRCRNRIGQPEVYLCLADQGKLFCACVRERDVLIDVIIVVSRIEDCGGRFELRARPIEGGRAGELSVAADCTMYLRLSRHFLYSAHLTMSAVFSG